MDFVAEIFLLLLFLPADFFFSLGRLHAEVTAVLGYE